MYKVSILTVVKNNFRQIDLTIQSVINQSIKNKEYIIVDGCSTDGTYEIIEKYSKKYPFIKSFKKKDNNLYEALNFGIKNLSGEYLHLLHSGDFYYSENSLQNIYNFSKSKSSEVTFSPLLYFNKDFNISRLWALKNNQKILFDSMPHTTLFMSKKNYKKYLYNTNYKISADTYYMHVILKKIKKINIYNEPLIFMNSYGLSSAFKFFFIKFFEDLRIYFRIYKLSCLYFYIRKVFFKLPQFFIKDKNSQLKLKKIINKLDIKNYYIPHLKRKIILNLNYNINLKKFILSACNLAFIGSLMQKKICLNKGYFSWPDGESFNFFSRLTKKKIPGRELVKKLIVPIYINNIVIIGNLSELAKIYVKKKFENKKITHINIPYDQPYYLYNLLPKFKYNQLLLLTVSTPKQELLAEHIYDNNDNCKIICIGGALEMLSGQEQISPDFFYKNNLEFLWRLRFDTIRRLRRLIISLIYSSKFFLFRYKIILKP
jgi:glycosyltransferase